MDKGRGEEMERKGERNQIIFIALKCSFTLANIPFYFILFCLLVSRFGFLSFVVILPTQGKSLAPCMVSSICLTNAPPIRYELCIYHLVKNGYI